MSIRKIIVLIAVFFTAINISVNAADYSIYPLNALFKSFNLNNPVYDKMFEQNKAQLLNQYKSEFTKDFGNVVNEIDNAASYKTFAAYVTIPRASKYIPKERRLNGTLLDIYAPVSMNIYLINLLSGETLYSNYLTQPVALTFDADSKEDYQNKELAISYKDSTQNLITNLLNRSANQINNQIQTITTNVIDSYKNIYVLDKGLSSGIAKDNILVNPYKDRIKIIYSALNYSVAKNLIGNAKIGDTFIKHATVDSVKQIQKPKILPINDMMNDKLYTIFSGEFVNDSKFSIMAMDNSYHLMKRTLPKLNKDFDETILDKRSTPDYFLKLYLSMPGYARFKTDKSFIERDKIGTVACGVIFDRTGRVVYSTCADEMLEKEVKNNNRLSKLDYADQLTNNVTLALARNMKNSIEFQNMEFKIIKSQDDVIYVSDKNGYLKKGLKLTVFKNIKPLKLGFEILVPTREYKVIGYDKDNAIAVAEKKTIVQDAPYAKTTDTIRMSVIPSTKKIKTNIFNFVPQDFEMEGNTVSFNERIFKGIAFAALASTMKSPIVMPKEEFERSLENLSDKGFERDVTVLDNSDKLTVKVAYKIEKKDEKFLLNGKIINRQYNITVKVTSKNKDKIIKEKTATKTVTIELPRHENEEIIQYELLKNTYLLIQQASAKV